MITVIPIRVQGEVKSGKSLAAIISKALEDSSVDLQDGDILVVAQKIVSKAEGRVVDLATVMPSAKALRLAKKLQKDARLVELILQESKEIVIVKNGIIITETRHGFICANSGVDQSNIGDDNSAVLLPVDPDKSAKRLRNFFHVAVIITDTFGRPFREGQANVAVGVAGIKPIKSYIGKKDMFGRRLHVTEIAVADEIASAAELAMGKAGGIPVAVVRGYAYEKDAKASSKPLVRKKKTDLFRRSRG
ncbi:MAG: coenzyme F420-0:L-glutamate ligase [Nitrososphaera sp.]|uniref:coenzyme F420-0:L-glutamate ligase n=1 Tax=Nitrososphaera sp. TaxID=1971748 RepID=UPI003D6E3913